ncbi:MG2 domain-containing protein [Melaminivora sp.]|uniref:alpha-2-macroglobulin family protein n=1 Tax=Melaminivora sp. TaxID=1933032 RepID=UPI0028B0ABDF|nr:MG2 domain-containing protein [Melaminivora sp.]
MRARNITTGLAATLLLLTGLAGAGAAHAQQTLKVAGVSPQGEVARVQQVVVRFEVPAVQAGDARAPAPATVACSDAEAGRGTGRWNSEREWVYDFASDLPPGVRCTITAKPGFKSPQGAGLARGFSYQFNTGGPHVQDVQPGTWQEIDEEQYFVLRLNGPATTASVQQNTWCVADGVGERIPVRLIEGKERQAILKATHQDKAATRAPLRYATLACTRRLTAGTRMQLVYGRGVATPGGIANTAEERFAYQVREPFKVEFSCERENAQAACLPIRPLRVNFNAPVPARLAQAIRLKGAGQTLSPRPPREGEGREGRADGDVLVDGVSFAPPLAAQSGYTLELPKGFQDAAGRAPANGQSFPMPVATGALPPLAKFAATPFGVVERYAEGPEGPALLPVTLRNVEAQLAVQGLQPGAPAPQQGAAQVRTLQPAEDADIIAWLRRVERWDTFSLERVQARRDTRAPLPAPLPDEGDGERDQVQTRMVPLLAGQPGVRALELPRPAQGEPRPFEVVGIPLPPGFSVVEIASPLLGASLLDERHGAARTMYVRTTALVTNLGVHFKLGRENAVAWVTTLDKGQPVAGARVRVSACDGRSLASATTDASGVARFEGLSPEPPACSGGGDDWRRAYFVSARGGDDLAFAWSDWQRGIEPWRFNVPTASGPQPDEVAHTVFDRTLLRAGETVSMKHLLRSQTGAGFALPARRPRELVITHVGSGQQYTQTLAWRGTPTGGLSASSQFQVPPAAALGQYQVQLRGGGPAGEDAGEGGRSLDSGSFRVEEFRLPVLQGRIAPAASAPLVHARSVTADVQVGYVSGGAAARLPVRVSALVRAKVLHFEDFDTFSFQGPRKRAAQAGGEGGGDGEEEPAASQDARVVADKLPLTLDKNGTARTTIEPVPQARQAQDLVLEATYADPNGEVQTLHATHTLWPAGVVAGIKAEDWAASTGRVRFQALALDLDGRPQAGVPLAVQAVARTTTTSRKRMVGGFYSYDNRTETRDLGTVCSGTSDGRGLLLCDAQIDEPGEVELIATARDKDGNQAEAATSVWVARRGELWFGGQDHDRIDVLPEKKSYEPGETARLQVRMPFRFATALVAVEREGVIDTRVVQLNGQDPIIELKVEEGWAPNVYVSVLSVRGRLREVPWYSFFTWGFKAPREWWSAFWHEGREYVAPTALVDLAKPAYRLGLAELRVGARAHRIDVQVQADQESYPVRGQAQVTVRATLAGGKPAAGAEVALAVVDEALLELMPNTSWNLLDAMLARRAWGVETSTAQMEIIGRRHYGKKAVPAGGGGGRAQTRELLDTLLLWQPAVRLDERGEARVTVPLNDALTTFRVVAVADAGTGQFGTGATRIRATQDLQIVSGLPPLVRGGDRFRAQITLRNTTARPMRVEVTPRAALLQLAAQTVELPAGEAREVAWDVTAPEALGAMRAQALPWEVQARDTLGGARDALKLSQRIVPAVPLAVQQASLRQIDGDLQLPVAPPADALPGRGGLQLSLQPRLAEGLPGVRDWWERYPYTCLEQQASRAIGLQDAQLWQAIAARLPTYLDADGLASYFPPRAGDGERGSDTLTAYLLAATHEAAGLDAAFALPPEARAAMERGLIAFVEGRIERKYWSPQRDLDLRKLAAIEALSRYGRATPRMLQSLRIAPNQWPTHAVIDWVNVLKRLDDAGLPERGARLAEALQILRARLSWQGTRLGFADEAGDHWWWLMQGADVNAARLILAVLDEPDWQADLGRLAAGFIARQQGGAWPTTTANFWGGMALAKFSARFESAPVAGSTRATLGGQAAAVDWSQVRPARTADATGAAHQGSGLGAPAAPGLLAGNRMFLPWPTGPEGGAGTLAVQHQGTGRPWLTLQSLAAVPLKEPFSAGFSIRRSVTPVEQADKNLPAGQYSRGDILRVTLEVSSRADMTWVAITDPIPGGATILGSGLGRDSEIATEGERREGAGWPAYEERSFEAFRSYYEYLPKGTVKMQYTVRLNNAGDFALPPSRVEALYAPEMRGEAPNAAVKVLAPKP